MHRQRPRPLRHRVQVQLRRRALEVRGDPRNNLRLLNACHDRSFPPQRWQVSSSRPNTCLSRRAQSGAAAVVGPLARVSHARHSMNPEIVRHTTPSICMSATEFVASRKRKECGSDRTHCSQRTRRNPSSSRADFSPATFAQSRICREFASIQAANPSSVSSPTASARMVTTASGSEAVSSLPFICRNTSMIDNATRLLPSAKQQ